MHPIVQSSTQNFSGHTSGVVVGKPAGLAVGDLWVAHLHVFAGTPIVTLPAGWTVLSSIATSYAITTFYKIANSTDVSSSAPSVTFNVNTYAYTITERITSYNTTTPFGTPVTDSVSGVFTWTSSASVTPAYANSLVLLTYGEVGSYNSGMGNSGDTVFGNPDGTVTGIQNFGGSSPSQYSGTAVYDIRSGTSPTNGWVINPGSNYADWVASMVVVNPYIPPAGTLYGFTITDSSGNPIPNQIVSTTFNAKITAVDYYGTTITSFTGTVDLTSNGSGFVGGGTTASFVAGVLTVPVSFTNKGSGIHLIATKTASVEYGQSNNFNIVGLYSMQQHQGNIFYPVKNLPTLSNLKHINVFMAVNDDVSGSQKEAALTFYFNGSANPWATKYVTRDDIKKGYVSYEINKPYINSVQIEVQYFNAANLNPEGLYSNIGVADFCPSYAELIYQPTTTLG